MPKSGKIADGHWGTAVWSDVVVVRGIAVVSVVQQRCLFTQAETPYLFQALADV
ncbi:MAG: hypothetical protein Q7U39_01275 [Nitrospira sp.]|nr:hypothetical protein [Nitrospira sp.]